MALLSKRPARGPLRRRVDFTVAGYLDWVGEDWLFTVEADHDEFVARNLLAMERRGFRSVSEKQFEQAVAKRATQPFDPHKTTPLDRGSKLLLQFLKASGDGVVRLVRKRGNVSEWWQLTLQQDYVGDIKWAASTEAIIHSKVFHIVHDDYTLKESLQNTYCCDDLDALIRKGYRQATQTQLERAQVQR